MAQPGNLIDTQEKAAAGNRAAAMTIANSYTTTLQRI
jgi:hypothetical protein